MPKTANEMHNCNTVKQFCLVTVFAFFEIAYADNMLGFTGRRLPIRQRNLGTLKNLNKKNQRIHGLGVCVD